MRLGYWSPLPPQRSGIADYSFELLHELRELVDVVAVVRDEVAGEARAPDGVEIVAASAFDRSRVDLCMYQMGNNPPYHGYMLGQLYRDPGVTVLHDPSLVDFYAAICGGAETAVFRYELNFDSPDIGLADPIPTIDAGGHRDPDRLQMLLARRVVNASRQTLVNSRWARDLMRARYPGAAIDAVYLGTPLSNGHDTSGSSAPGTVQFGAFGGINYYKRVVAVAAAFREVHRRCPDTRLVIVGRADDRRLADELREVAREPDVAGALDVLTDVSLDELERLIRTSHVAISLRWPTAGEMSATLMRSLGAGRPVIVSEAPQFLELDASFCWRVPIDPELELEVLVETMVRAASDAAWRASAGAAARKFVESNATYDVVARQYVEYAERCMKPSRAWPVSAPAIIGRQRSGARVTARRLEQRWRAPDPADGAGSVETPRAAGLALDGDPGTLAELLATSDEAELLVEVSAHQPLARSTMRGLSPPPRVVRVLWCGWEPPWTPPALPPSGTVDALWVGSSHLGDRLPIGQPATAVPPPVQAEGSAGPSGAARWGLPPRHLVVSYLLDARLGVARQNPEAAVEAFRAAFARSSTPAALLVIGRHLGEAPGLVEALQRQLAGVPHLLVSEVGSDGERRALLAAADIHLSLHRSSGTGREVLEAMALGKAVVATGFGATSAMLSNHNGCPVSFRLAAVEPAAMHRETADNRRRGLQGQWADPSTAEAARWLTRLASSPAERARLGAEARATVETRYSRRAVGILVRDLLGNLLDASHRRQLDHQVTGNRRA